MTDQLPNPHAETNSKRRERSDDEDFCERLGYVGNSDRNGSENVVESRESKRFNGSDGVEPKNERPKDVVVYDSFSGGSSDEDYSVCHAVNNNNLKISTDNISAICKAFQEAKEVFAVGFNCTYESEEDRTKSSLLPYTNSCKRFESTVDDNEIRTSDIPERMQLRSPPVAPASEAELISEAQWIYNHAFERKTISIQDSHLTAEGKRRANKGVEIVSKIIISLELMKNQRLEVPFIAFYRKEYVLPNMDIQDLWKIYKYDAKYCQLSRSREALLNLYRRTKVFQDANPAKHRRSIDDDDIELLENAQTFEELYDFYRHFVLHYAQEIISKVQGDEGYDDHDNSYSAYRKAGLDNFAKKFGLTSKQFAVNLSRERQVHKIEREASIPCVVALNYINEQFRSTEEVIEAAKLMVATQIASEPLVRQSARKFYAKEAKISVRPTKKGIQLVHEMHPVYGMKYLKDKPVNDLVGEQYLKLAMAQDEQLITINFSDQVYENNYVERMKQLCCRDEPTEKYTQDWDVLRGGSVETALTTMILPDLKRELHATLLNEAKDCVMRSCARKIYNWIKVAPYRCPDLPDEKKHNYEWDSSRGLRVMGVAYVTGHTVAAFITPDGECTDYLNLPNLLKVKNSSMDRSTMDSVLAAIKNWIVAKKPHVIAIGGESSDALDIARDIRGVIASLAREKRLPSIAVEIVENEPAVVYSTSRRGVAEFPGYPIVLRQAISLARHLQDPLVELSQLCNGDGHEILQLKLHNLQGQLSKDDLLDNIHLEFVNRVNEVGVDVNRAVQRPYFANLVQFICGLGPRKAQYLLETLKQTDRPLTNRQQLATVCHMGPKLFANCAGFIKIEATISGETVLDNSRVHPENYDWAGKIVTEALDYTFEQANLTKGFKEIHNYPEKLMDLDLDAFAEELVRQGFGNKCITLYDIRSELVCRYKDLRIPYQSPKPDKLFGFFAKQTPEEFHVGKLVEATIVAIGTSIIWLRLYNGISGYIRIENLTDERLADPQERIHIGSRIYCRIVQIETEKFCVEASSKGSDLVDVNGEWRLPKDRYYDGKTEAKADLVYERARNMDQKQMDAEHEIIHRCFRNINYADSEKLMETMQRGDIVIRPSSKGDGYFCVTWKVTDGVNQHIAVREGKSSIEGNLWIGDDAFRNFDDIIARFVNPMAAYATELLNFKYYKPQIMGMPDKAEKMLKAEKKKNPRGIPYIISAARNNYGKFLLSYLPRDQCRHNYIKLTPNGLKFGGYRFARLNDLIHWFKEHSKDSIPDPIGPIAQRFCRARLDVTVKKITPKRIRKVARNLPDLTLQSLTQVVNRSSYSSQTNGRTHY